MMYPKGSLRYRLWLAAGSMFLAVSFLGWGLRLMGQPGLVIRNSRSFARISLPVGASFRVRLQSERFWRTAVLESVRQDTALLRMRSGLGEEVFRLPVASFSGVSLLQPTEGQKLRQAIGGAVALGGATFLVLRAAQATGPFFTSATLAPLAALPLGALLYWSGRARYRVGEGSRWYVQTVTFGN